jgi:hypothetical protein
MGRDCFLCGLCQGYITPVTNITVRSSRQEPDTGSSRREFRSVKVLFEVCYKDHEGMEYWRVRL